MSCNCSDCANSRIKRREYRQSPLLPEDEIPHGHPKGKNKKTPKAAHRLKHKHVWVEVEYPEYHFYARGSRYPWDVWFHQAFERVNSSRPYTTWTTYLVCADCLDVKIERDDSKRRAWDRKYRRKVMRARARA